MQLMAVAVKKERRLMDSLIKSINLRIPMWEQDKIFGIVMKWSRLP